MAACDPQQLLTDGRCFAAMNPASLQVAIVTLWCEVAQNLVAVDNVSIQSIDDLNWYEMRGDQIAPGSALLFMGQTPTAPGVETYRVIVDPDTLLKYKVQAWGVPNAVSWQLDPTPTAEAETPTVITVSGGAQYNLVIRSDPDPLPVLEPV